MTAALRFKDSTVAGLNDGEELIVGRQNHIPDNTSNIGAISRRQLRFSLDHDSLNVTSIGQARCGVRRFQQDRVEPLQKNTAFTLADGDEIVLLVTTQQSQSVPLLTVCYSNAHSQVSADNAVTATDSTSLAAERSCKRQRVVGACNHDSDGATVHAATTTGDAIAAACVGSSSMDVGGSVLATAETTPAIATTPVNGAGGRAVAVEAKKTAPLAVDRFCALRMPWKCPGEPCRDATVTLSLEEARHARGHPMLTAHVCDGIELRATAAPVVSPWPSFPSANVLHGTLKHHPFDMAQWQLQLTWQDGTPPLKLDLQLVRSTAPGSHRLGGVGGEMLCELLDARQALQALCDSRAAEVESLRAHVRQRTDELHQRADGVQARSAEALASWLPIMVAKQQRLSDLEREAQLDDLYVSEDNISEDSDDHETATALSV